MADDPLDRLRRTNPFPEPLAAPPWDRVRHRLGERPRQRTRAGGGMLRGLQVAPLLLAVAISMAIAATALIVLRHSAPPPAHVATGLPTGLPPIPPATRANGPARGAVNRARLYVIEHDRSCLRRRHVFISAPHLDEGRPSRALRSAFAVLNRPASDAPRHPELPPSSGVYFHDVRIAERRYGFTFVVFAVKDFLVDRPVTTRCDGLTTARLKVQLRHASTSLRRRALALERDYVRDDEFDRRHPEVVCVSGDSVSCSPFLAAATHGGGGSIGYGRDGGLFVDLVPNGVASIVVDYATGHPRMITVRVVDNLAVWTLRHGGLQKSPSRVLWRSANGRVVRVVQS